MLSQFKEEATLWREDSPIWEIIAGEVVLQQDDSLAGDPQALTRMAAERAGDATRLMREGDRDGAGHALIGCSVALALATRVDDTRQMASIEDYASDLAGSLSWQAVQPTATGLERLAEQLTRLTNPDVSRRGPTPWELAVQAGGYAAAMSQHITRRRQRRDLLAVAGGAS